MKQIEIFRYIQYLIQLTDEDLIQEIRNENNSEKLELLRSEFFYRAKYLSRNEAQ